MLCPFLLKQINQQVEHRADYEYKNNSKQDPHWLTQRDGSLAVQGMRRNSTDANCTEDRRMLSSVCVDKFHPLTVHRGLFRCLLRRVSVTGSAQKCLFCDGETGHNNFLGPKRKGKPYPNVLWIFMHF